MAKGKVVLLPIPAAGHIMSTLELAKLLHRYHFSVTVLIAPVPHSPVDGCIASVAASGLDIDFCHLQPVDLPKDADGPEDFISAYMEEQKHQIKSALQDLLRSGDAPLAALIVDLFATGAIDVAADLGVPCYVYFASNAAFLALMLYLPTLEEKFPVEFEEMEEEVRVPGVCPIPPMSMPSPFMRKKSGRYTCFVHHGRRYSELKGIVINTFTDLEPATLRALEKGLCAPGRRTPPVYPVGPLIAREEGEKSRQHECVVWLDKQPARSVVFLCFGSKGCFSAAQVVEIAAGLEGSGCRFLWALRVASEEEVFGIRKPADAKLEEVLPEGFLERTKARGMVWPSWAPQAEILAHRAVGGFLLCYCDRKKLEWYLRRGLAKMVEEDPPAIMLLFETKGRPEDEGNEFYIQSKKNMCVGCGEKSHYIRYRIIPSCYRMHFPEHLKSHRSHDIVLLCVDCHEIAHSAAEKYKRQVAQEFGIPLFVQKIVNSGESTAATVASTSISAEEETGVSPLQLRTAAMALLRHGSNMPSGRFEELMQIVRTYFGRQEVSVEDLEAALLVGMSPHERRRFEKKRGLSFRHTEQNVVYKNYASSSSQTNNHNKVNSCAHVSEKPTEKDKESISDQRIHSNLSTVDTNGNLLLETFGSSSIQILDREVEIEQGNASYLKMDIENEDQLDDSSVNLLLMPDEITTSETAKKVSLLGHGPHGKQVVEHLLKRNGEEGVRQFCQRWRKVFVDAIHPRFLPLGWDIMHSGRRDFGDYSVYNPTKKGLPETNTAE